MGHLSEGLISSMKYRDKNNKNTCITELLYSNYNWVSKIALSAMLYYTNICVAVVGTKLGAGGVTDSVQGALALGPDHVSITLNSTSLH